MLNFDRDNLEAFMKKLAVLGFCFVVMLLGWTGDVGVAQTITGSVRGLVTDPSGAAVVGAGIDAANVATGVTTHTTSDSAGLYNIQFLTIGSYTVTARASGFSTTTAGPFVLEIDQIAKINLKLQVGRSATTVAVMSDAAPLLNTENATLGTSISANTLESMPLDGLNVYYAANFVPGVVNPTIASQGGVTGAYRGAPADPSGIPSVNGNRQQSNNFILDGVEVNETIANTIGYNPSPYSVQEMRVITGNADAEYGNVNGGDIVIVSKSGTSQFHGSAFEYYKNQDLAANSWGNNHVTPPTPKSDFSTHQFGGAIGGPILKDKLFFFADYLGFRYNTSGGVTTSIPDALERNGDFSEILAIEGTQLYDTSNGNGAAAVPYANNQGIPINNPVAKYLFSHPDALPLPNHAPDPGFVTENNYIATQATQNINDQADGRIDYTISHSDNLMVKGTWGDANDHQSQVLPVAIPRSNDYPFYMGVVNWVHTFSPSLVNEARGGFSRIVQRQNVSDPSGIFGTKGNSLIGIPLAATQTIIGFTGINIGNSDAFGGYGWGTPTVAGKIAADNNFVYGDNLTWVHGRHVTKFGVQFVRYQENYFDPGNLGGILGSFNYGGAYTAAGTSVGDGLADFELDKAGGAQTSGQAGPFGARQWRDAYYVQDDWKLFPNLTLNLGLRYGYDQPMYEVNDKMVSVDLKKAYFAPVGTDPSTLLRFAGRNGNSRSLINPYYHQFMPRIGFALQANPRTVVRGGYSITNAMEGTGSGLRMTQNPPFLASFTNNATSPSETSAGTWLPAANGFALANPTAVSSQYDVWDPNLKPTSVQQFNLATQFQVLRKMSAQIGYVGQLGRHLATPVLLNQYIAPVGPNCVIGVNDTDPGCATSVAPYYALVGAGSQVVETTFRSVSSYNALQATIHQQASNGLEFTINYTYSKSLTNNPGGFLGVPGTLGGLMQYWNNAYDPHADYGRSGFDVPTNLSATVVYELPFGHNKQFGSSWNRLTEEALGGWKLAGNGLYSSGFPITLYQNPGNDNLNGAADQNFNYNGYGRVNQYFRPKLVHRSLSNWFGTDPSAVPCTTAGATINKLGVACAYGKPAFNQFGNAQNNTERGPNSKIIDLSLFKSFQTFREQTVKFRVDAFNAFNIVNYGLPASRVGKSTFGLINATSTGTYAPRQFQLSVVYQF